MVFPFTSRKTRSPSAPLICSKAGFNFTFMILHFPILYLICMASPLLGTHYCARELPLLLRACTHARVLTTRYSAVSASRNTYSAGLQRVFGLAKFPGTAQNYMQSFFFDKART